MRIVVHGQQAFGKAVLERLMERGDNVVAICCAPQKPGKPDDPLARCARDNGIPLHQPGSWKTPEALELMKSFEADVCMMAYVLLFVPQAVLDAPRLGTFQYHPSLCPHHRGPSSINWPIAMGKTMTGLTIFWPNDGLDEGPILLQKTCTIGPDETLGDIYFGKLFPMGVDAMTESLDLVKSGVFIRHDQRLEDGSYESWFGSRQSEIDWTRPVAETYNIIRASDPAPGAWTTWNGRKVRLYAASRSSGDGKPGNIVDVSGEGVTVQANGGRIMFRRIRPHDAGKIAASEWAAIAGIRAGNSLGT